jgi:hypothetical protein
MRATRETTMMKMRRMRRWQRDKLDMATTRDNVILVLLWLLSLSACDDEMVCV